jgi:hypothetical protein
MSLLVVDFFCTPISLLNNVTFHCEEIPCQIFKKYLPSAILAACPTEARPGAGPLGGGPDHFGGPLNCYTGSQFGPRPKLSDGRRIGPAPSPAAPDLSPNPLAYLNAWGPLPKLVPLFFFLPHARPHLHGHCPLKLLLLLVYPPNQITPNLDWVTWRPSTVSPFDPLLLLALVLLLICSCYCMSRSRVYLGLGYILSRGRLVRVSSNRWPSFFPWHLCSLKVCRHKF